MAKKCYAVRKGNKTGIFYSWDECKSAIDGFSGAEYRGFNDEEEALSYMRGNSTAIDRSSGQRVIINKPTKDNEVNIFSDGSYKDGIVTFGIYLESNKGSWKFYGAVECPQYASINNIAGELFAVMVGVQLAIDMGFKILNILYDQTGVESWYTGDWKAKGQLQSIYVTLMNQLRLKNDLTYEFRQVKGHSGVEGNVIADKMAKRARNFMHFVSMNSILRGIIKVNDVPLF